MEDYLTEDDQWQALKRWLKENGTWIVGGVVLGAGGWLGANWWETRTTTRAERASAEYLKFQETLADTPSAEAPAQAQEIVTRLRTDHTGTPYADHAELALARLAVESGRLDEAAERLATVADSTRDEYLGQVARLRLARVQVAQDKPDAALATLRRLDSGALAALAGEVRGDAWLAKGERAAALEAYQAALLANDGSADRTQLQLKITDLATPAESPVTAPTGEGEASDRDPPSARSAPSSTSSDRTGAGSTS